MGSSSSTLATANGPTGIKAPVKTTGLKLRSSSATVSKPSLKPPVASKLAHPKKAEEKIQKSLEPVNVQKVEEQTQKPKSLESKLKPASSLKNLAPLKGPVDEKKGSKMIWKSRKQSNDSKKGVETEGNVTKEVGSI